MSKKNNSSKPHAPQIPFFGAHSATEFVRKVNTRPECRFPSATDVSATEVEVPKTPGNIPNALMDQAQALENLESAIAVLEQSIASVLRPDARPQSQAPGEAPLPAESEIAELINDRTRRVRCLTNRVLQTHQLIEL